MESIIKLQQAFSTYIQGSEGIPFLGLIAIAFSGGLLASLTPCVLPMIPLYLSYIGATDVKSKKDAINKSFLFCLGSAFVFSLLGIFASLASFIMVDYKGYIDILIGLFIILMALSLAEIIHLPLPQVVKTIPESNPFIIGVAFSLISSPCASPILFAVIAISSTVNSSIKSTLIMIAYSVGYTGLIFLVGVFGGLARGLTVFKNNSKKILIVSSIILALLGMYYVYSGVNWFIG